MRCLVVVLTLAFAALGCQGQPVALLEDPDAILAAAATSTAAATSVRADLTVEGRLALDMFGAGAAPIDLRDTTLQADLDLRTGLGRIAFSSPGLLGMTGEAILANDGTYVRTSMSGAKYLFLPGETVPEDPLKGVGDLLARTDLDPLKGDDVPCAGGTCYTLTIQLTPDELAALGGAPLPTDLPVPMPDLSAASVDLTLHIEQATTRLSDASIKAALGELGEVTIVSTFTHWNEPFTISVPPADQVEGAG